MMMLSFYEVMKILIVCFGVSPALKECKVYNNNILHNGVCKACPIGSYGLNCTHTCPPGYHGDGCSRECNCSTSQYCHPVYGCGILTTNGTFYVLRDKDIVKEETCAKVIVLNVSLSTGVMLLLILIYTTCFHQGRCNIRNAVSKKLERLAVEIYESYQQRQQEGNITESNEHQNTYAEIESLSAKPETGYNDLSLESITIRPTQSSRSESMSMSEARSDEKSKDGKCQCHGESTMVIPDENSMTETQVESLHQNNNYDLCLEPITVQPAPSSKSDNISVKMRASKVQSAETSKDGKCQSHEKSTLALSLENFKTATEMCPLAERTSTEI